MNAVVRVLEFGVGGLVQPPNPNSRTQTTALIHSQLGAAYRSESVYRIVG